MNSQPGTKYVTKKRNVARSLSAVISCGLIAFSVAGAQAKDRHQHRAATESSSSSVEGETCYDPSDSTEIRLWDRRAPGATGDDPCRDIPFLKVYRAVGNARGTGTAIIVIPGGGYDRLTDLKEQAPVGEYFSHDMRVTTFVLFYRLASKSSGYGYPVPMWDAQRAVKLVRARAPELGIAPGRIGIFGFSAGGHLASTIALHPDTDFGLSVRDGLDHESARPDFLGLGYPVISMVPDQFASPNSLKHLLGSYQGQELVRLEHYLSGQEHVTPGMPPVFLFESLDDKQISSQNSVLFAQALKAAHASAEVHLFDHGVHGAGLAEGIPGEEAWPDMFRTWLDRMGFTRN